MPFYHALWYVAQPKHKTIKNKALVSPFQLLVFFWQALYLPVLITLYRSNGTLRNWIILLCKAYQVDLEQVLLFAMWNTPYYLPFALVHCLSVSLHSPLLDLQKKQRTIFILLHFINHQQYYYFHV